MAIISMTLERKSGDFHMEVRNGDGVALLTDGSPDIGGQGKGVRPMELLLAALASCSSIDVVLILKKQRQQLDDIKVHITGDRVSVLKHSEYRHIHLHFEIHGKVSEPRARKAIEMSLGTYCSVAQILKKTATISYDLVINPVDH